MSLGCGPAAVCWGECDADTAAPADEVAGEWTGTIDATFRTDEGDWPCTGPVELSVGDDGVADGLAACGREEYDAAGELVGVVSADNLHLRWLLELFDDVTVVDVEGPVVDGVVDAPFTATGSWWTIEDGRLHVSRDGG